MKKNLFETRVSPSACRAPRAILVCAMAAVAIAVAAPAHAGRVSDGPQQDTPTATPARAPKQTMVLTFTLSGGSSEDRTNVDSNAGPRTPVADADVALAYHRRGKHSTFDLNGRSVVREEDSTVTPMRQQVEFTAARVGRRQQFSLNQSASYSPSYQFGGMTNLSLSPETDVAESHGDFANTRLAALASNTDVDWGMTLGRHYSLSASYSVRRTMFDHASLDMTSQDVGGRISRRLTRYLSLRTGYTYRIADSALATGGQLRVHDIDAGIDFSRPITFSRRTTFSFASGSSLTPSAHGMAYRATGDAALTKLMGRSWNARIGLKRSVRLVEGFAQPVVDNAASAALSGNLRRRLSLSLAGSLSAGTIGLESGAGNDYTNWTVASGFGISLGRRAAIDVQYFAAGDDFDEAVILPPGVQAQRTRQGVRLSLTWRAPLIRY